MGRGRARQRARESSFTRAAEAQNKAIPLVVRNGLFVRAAARRPLPLAPSRKGREDILCAAEIELNRTAVGA
jgi:hypothetical protein